MKQKRFKVEELYKNEWQPCIVKHKGEKMQRVVKITQEEADANNIYKVEYGLRYILDDSKKEESKADLANKYTELFGKKPFAGWDAKMLNEKINEELSK